MWPKKSEPCQYNSSATVVLCPSKVVDFKVQGLTNLGSRPDSAMNDFNTWKWLAPSPSGIHLTFAYRSNKSCRW